MLGPPRARPGSEAGSNLKVRFFAATMFPRCRFPSGPREPQLIDEGERRSLQSLRDGQQGGPKSGLIGFASPPAAFDSGLQGLSREAKSRFERDYGTNVVSRAPSALTPPRLPVNTLRSFCSSTDVAVDT